MALSSQQIAQLNGSFIQQYQQQQAFAQSIQPPGYNFGGMNTGAQNEGLAGRGLNTAMAVGAPAATLGLGLMGLDPISMGVRSGMAAGGMGGMGAGLAVGAGVAGIGMAGMGALSYMGNQMVSGAQQTQQFNQGMRGGYNFFNPHADHGRGFSEGDIRQIGGNVRGMAGGQMGGSFGGASSQFELGPSFSELGRLAANMGRMGLADGVRNAKEFTTKFREMMQSVKTIAEDMGTTLEEAQKTMAAMKGSGIFKNQAGVSGAIRGASVSGGLATTEVTGMMNIGSQVSRMFGGTGRQGAMGGIKSIEQVGSAQQMGILTEEDIYQATGLTGAEGRQAMAQQNMVQTGSFLKSSKGRWLLASLAGKNGRLDDKSVNEFMSGSMSVNDTRGAAHRNLAGVGRANFIRNEGRLRGAVMEEFGGLAPAMAMMGWAQGKGIDINSMGDREMLFMQRQMGMGRDEADSLVKMARRMPELIQHHREAQVQDSFSREHGMRAEQSGIEGIKRKLEAAKNSVNNSMQKVGQDILNHATDAISEWGNRLANTYEETGTEGISDIKRSLLMGGAAGAQAASRLKGATSLGGITGASGPHEDVGQRNLISRTQELQFNARMATSAGLGSDMVSLIGKNRSALMSAYAANGGLGDLGGEDRIHAFGQAIKDPAFQAKWKKMKPGERAQFVQQAEGQLGITNRLSESDWGVPTLPGLTGGGALHTEAARNEDLGRSVLGMRHDDAMSSASHWGAGGKHIGAAAGAGMGLIAGGLGGVAGFKVGGWLGEKAGNLVDSTVDMLTGRTAKAQAAGAYLRGGEGSNLSFDVFSGKEGALEDIQLKIANLKRGGNGKLSDEEQGQLEALQKLADGAKMIKAAGGYSKLTAEQKAQLGPIAQGAKDVAAANMTKVREQVGRTTEQEGQLLRAGGVAHLEGGSLVINADTEANLMKKGGKGAVQGLKLAMAAQTADAAFAHGGDIDAQQSASTAFTDWMAHASVKDLRAVAVQTAGTARGGFVSESLMRGNAIENSKRKLGVAGAVASNMLGMNLSKDELAKLKGMSTEDQAAWLSSKAGLGQDKEFTEGLKESIAAAGKKGGGVAGGILLQNVLAKDKTAADKLSKANSGQPSEEEKIIDKLGESNRYLKAMVESNPKMLAAMNNIANKDKKDSEK